MPADSKDAQGSQTAAITDLQVDLEMIEWVGSLSFECYGARIGIRSNDASFIAHSRERLPPHMRPNEGGSVDVQYSLVAEGGFFLVYRDAKKYMQAMRLRTALGWLELDLHKCVGINAPDHLFVHSGAVGWEGCGIVIPGRTRLGKTSLVAELVRQGATYYSDDWTVFDREGMLVPYAKPLMMRQPTGGRRNRQAEEIGGRVALEPMPVGLVVMTRYREGSQWRPRENSQAQAMMELLDRVLVSRKRPEFTLGILRKAVANAAVLKGPRGEADEVARAILDYAARSELSHCEA